MNNKTTTETREEIDGIIRKATRHTERCGNCDKTVNQLMQLIQQEKQALLEITDQTIIRLKVVADQLAINQRDVEAVNKIGSIIMEYEKLAEIKEGKGEK